MSAVVDPRKRIREEDVNEFMPLSKRINNLHLNNNGGVGFPTEHHPAVASMHMPLLEGHQASFPQCSSSSSSSGSTCHSIPSGGSSPSNGGACTRPPSHGGQDALVVNGEALGEYCPDLSEHENPHYFNRNKVLYELFLERMRRGQ